MSTTYTTSMTHRFLCALADGLAKREGLSGVQVATFLMGKETRDESIQFTDGDSGQEWGPLGAMRRDETIIVHGVIWKRLAGKGEDVVRAARARVFEILAEVEDELRLRCFVPDESGNMTADRVSALMKLEWDQGATPTNDRWAAIRFDVQAKATLPRR